MSELEDDNKKIDPKSWWIYEGTNKKDKKKIEKLPKPPSWRDKELTKTKKNTFVPSEEEIDLINTALYLRRPLLVTGKPGTGKSSLAKSVAYELDLGDVLHWQVTTKSTLEDGLYNYDAIGRLQESSLDSKNPNKPKETNEIGKYIRLGALGTAFVSKSIRVVLIDEIDKSDIDLPNNLLHVLEENEFTIPELARLDSDEKHKVNTQGSKAKAKVKNGKVKCNQNFPLIIMTSNGEREFPPAFLRRCIHLEMKLPDADKLKEIVESHLTLRDDETTIVNNIIDKFVQKRDSQDLATDQLLNAIFLELEDKKIDILNDENKKMLESIWHSLSN